MEDVWVVHPEFGKVKFSSPTPRQKEVLKYYEKLYDKVNTESMLSHEEEIKRFLSEKEKSS